MRCTYNKENGKKSSVWLYHNNQATICQSLFWNMIHTYRTSGYQQCLHFHQLEHLPWLNQVFADITFQKYGFSRPHGQNLKMLTADSKSP
jgi:hypothetical protein